MFIESEGFSGESVDERNLIDGETQTEVRVFSEVKKVGKFWFTCNRMNTEGC